MFLGLLLRAFFSSSFEEYLDCERAAVDWLLIDNFFKGENPVDGRLDL